MKFTMLVLLLGVYVFCVMAKVSSTGKSWSTSRIGYPLFVAIFDMYFYVLMFTTLKTSQNLRKFLFTKKWVTNSKVKPKSSSLILLGWNRRFENIFGLPAFIFIFSFFRDNPRRLIFEAYVSPDFSFCEYVEDNMLQLV